MTGPARPPHDPFDALPSVRAPRASRLDQDDPFADLPSLVARPIRAARPPERVSLAEIGRELGAVSLAAPDASRALARPRGEHLDQPPAPTPRVALEPRTSPVEHLEWARVAQALAEQGYEPTQALQYPSVRERARDVPDLPAILRRFPARPGAVPTVPFQTALRTAVIEHVRPGISPTPEPDFAQGFIDAAARQLREKYRFKSAAPGGVESEQERIFRRQIANALVYGARAGTSVDQLEAEIEQDLVDIAADESGWAQRLGTMLGDFLDPTLLVAGVGAERATMRALEMAAVRGSPLARRVLRLANTPAGAELQRRLVARATHGFVTGGPINVAAQGVLAAEEARLPTVGELGGAFAAGTALGPAFEVGGSLLAAPFRAAGRGRGPTPVETTAREMPANLDAIANEARDLSLIPRVQRTPEQQARFQELSAQLVAEGIRMAREEPPPPIEASGMRPPAPEPPRPVEVAERELPVLERRQRRVPVDVERRQAVAAGPEGGVPEVLPVQPGPGEVPLPSTIVRLPTDQIVADPARFQFKSLGSEGVSGELKGVTRFNEQLASVISVWRDSADGRVYVVNGHHRLELARRLGQRALNVQFIDAPTAELARAEGAFINIAEGRGTATDVAKFLRDLRATPEDLEARGVSLRGDLARDGLALSRLAPDVFDQVATAQVPQGWGVAIGSLLDDPVLQREAIAAARGSGKRLSQVEVTELARQVRDAGTEALTQETLFGTESERRGLFVQRAQLAAAVKKRLAGDRRLFGFVAREGRAEELGRAGETQIDVAAARDLAEGSARAEEIFDRLYTRSGPLADLVGEGARRIARGEKPATVLADIYPAIGEAVGRELRAVPGTRPDVIESPVPPGTRSLADEIAGTSQEPPVTPTDPAQTGLLSPARPERAPEARFAEPPKGSRAPVLASSEGPPQATMFTGREGTAAARSLAQTEAAARSEIEVLRQRFAAERDPARRSGIAAEIAEREKLVNRARGISEEELRTRAVAAGVPQPRTRLDQLAFLTPALPPTYQTKLKSVGADMPSVPHQAEVRTLMEISRRLAEAVGVPLRQGRFRAGLRRAKGVFFPSSEVARVTRFDRLGTVAHEIGHYISKHYLRNPTMRSARFRGAGVTPLALPRQAVAELVQMGKDLYGTRRPAAGYGEEGIAEWVSFYVTDPTGMKSKAPTFTAFMDQVFQAEPMLLTALKEARSRFATYQQVPAAERFDAMISVGERATFAPTVRDYMRVVWDDTYDVKAAVQELGSSRAPSDDAAILARLSRGAWGEAEEWLRRGVREHGTADMRTNTGIVETFEPLVRAGRAQALRRYLDAESALERWEHGIDPGFSREDARAIVAHSRNDPALIRAAEAAWAHSRALLKLRRDAGMLTEDQYQRILSANQRRVGFYRIFEPDEATVSRGGGRGGLGSAGLQGQTGSARRVVDPIEAIIRDTYITAKKVRQEQATRALVEHALATEGGGRIVEEVPAPQRPVSISLPKIQQQLADLGLVQEATDPKTGQKFAVPLDAADLEGVVHAFEDARVAGRAEAKDLVIPVLMRGELRWFQIKDRPLYDALVGLGPVEMSLWQRVLSFPKRLLQVGATTTLEFGFGNIGRDIVAQSVFSRGPWRPPLWRHLEGLYHILTRDPVYQRFKLHGAEQATMGGMDRPSLQLTARRLFGYFRTARQAWEDRGLAWSRATPAQKVLYVVGDLERVVLSPFEALRAVKEMSETMGRVGEFAAVERQALKRGAPPLEAATEAALGARDVGIDFQQLGSATRQVNHVIAFFGAFMRGWAQLGRELRARPHVVIPRIVAEVTVPSLALYYLQRDDPVYRDMPAWKRDLFWIYVQRGEDQSEGWDGYGSGSVEHVWMFPKPFELGILFGTLPERAAEWADRRNPEPGRAMVGALKRAVTPPYIPTAINPLVENYANRSTFRDRPIVPRSREGLVPAEQVRPQTGETARLLGQALDYSPAKIENLIRGYTGGAGGYVLSGTDAAIREAREVQGLPPLRSTRTPAEDPLVDVPGLRRFVSRIPGEDAESVERLYQRFERAERHRRTWRAMLQEGRTGEAAAYLEAHREQIVSVATREETQGEPGPLRAAYLQMQELQHLRREAGQRLAPDVRRRIADALRRVGAASTAVP